METHTSSTIVPFWKQIVGMLAGSVVALVLYGVYEIASPHLPAFASLIGTEESEAPAEETGPKIGENWDIVISRARAVLSESGQL